MSYSYVLPGERSSSGTIRRWLFAYTVAQLVCLAAATGAAAIARAMQWPAGSYETIALTAGVACVYGATFGYLRGSLIREKLARFSMPAWCAAIAVVSLFFVPPVPEAIPALKTIVSAESVLHSLGPVALSGFVYGIAVGAAEAFSLRRAALGLYAWVVMSGLAWGCGTAIAAAMASLQPAAFGTGTIVHIGTQAIVAGVVMFPALRMLSPRLNYYGPRAFRPALRNQA